MATPFSQVHTCLCFRAISFLSSTLMKEAAGSTEISMYVCQTTWCHTPGDSNPWHWNLNSYVTVSEHIHQDTCQNFLQKMNLRCGYWFGKYSEVRTKTESSSLFKDYSLLWNHVVSPQKAVRTSRLTHYLNCQYNFSKAVCAVWIIYSLHYELPSCISTMTNCDNYGLITRWV